MGARQRRAIPRFETPIIETHCHLDYLDEHAPSETLERAREVGVERVVTIAVAPDNLARARALARALPDVWATQGVHPHEAERYSDSVGAEIGRHIASERVVAVGEIGLDYHHDHADRKAQRRAFAAQLQIAAEAGMPVVIHTRDADQDTRDILRDFSRQLARKGVIHSFTAGAALAEYCLGEGFCLGFNGIATFKRADSVRSLLAATPPERILLETDAPYLTPVPYRGRPNEPRYLPFIAERVAEVKGLAVETLLRHAYRNSLRVFFPEEAAALASP